jgi:hypothetical protein
MTTGGDAPTPLEVLLRAMRLRWQGGQVDEAVALAKAAAPYVHAKPLGGRAAAMSALGDDKLDELCGTGVEGSSTSAGNQGQP